VKARRHAPGRWCESKANSSYFAGRYATCTLPGDAGSGVERVVPWVG
jgi:hypothetical protein